MEDILFSGNVQAPICRVRRKAWPFMVARRNHNTKKLHLESCPRSLMAANRVRELLQHFAAQPSSHSWQISPAENLFICNQCGLYVVDVPHRTTAERSYASKECGSGLSGLWKGVYYHDDGNVRLSILMTTIAVFTGCVSSSLVRIFLHTGRFFECLSGSKVSDVQIVRYIPLSRWFPPKFLSGQLNFNNFHQVQRIKGESAVHVLFWTYSQTLNGHDPVVASCKPPVQVITSQVALNCLINCPPSGDQFDNSAP